MKKATIQLLAMFAIVAMAIACSDDSKDDPGTTTDSGSTVDGTSGDGTATDSGANDAVSAADGATTTDAGATTGKYGKGCTSAEDQAFNKMLSTDDAKGAAMGKLVKESTLNKGCMAKSKDNDAKEIRDCISGHIQADALVKDNKASADCMDCYATKGYCGASVCLTACVADTTAPKCVTCLKEKCDSEFALCAAGDK